MVLSSSIGARYCEPCENNNGNGKSNDHLEVGEATIPSLRVEAVTKAQYYSLEKHQMKEKMEAEDIVQTSVAVVHTEDQRYDRPNIDR